MSDGLENPRRALTGVTFHRDGKTWTMSEDDANVVMGILRVASLKILPSRPTQRAAQDISDKYYDTTDETVMAVCYDWWSAAPPP